MATPKALRGSASGLHEPHSRYVTVGCRIRAPSEVEKAIDGADTCSMEIKDGTINCSGKSYGMHFCINSAGEKMKALGPYADQAAVMDEVGGNIVHHLLDGDDCLVVTFGGPESGKNHTMMGSWIVPSKRGLLPRVAGDLLGIIETEKAGQMSLQQRLEREASNGKKEGDGDEKMKNSKAAQEQQQQQQQENAPAIVKYKLFFRAWEVIGETINDLMVNPDYRPAGGLHLKPLPRSSALSAEEEDDGFFCPDLLWQRFDEGGNEDELHQLFKLAQDRVTTKSDNCPRSHVFFQILYEKMCCDGGRETLMREAAATFCILAPFGEAKKAVAAHADETHAASHKGKGSHEESLQHFVCVTHEAATGAGQIDYNNCVLTKMLKHNLESGFVAVIGCVSPAECKKAETVETLQFLDKLTSAPMASPAMKKSGSFSPERSVGSFSPTSGAAGNKQGEVAKLAEEIQQAEMHLASLKRKMAALQQ